MPPMLVRARATALVILTILASCGDSDNTEGTITSASNASQATTQSADESGSSSTGEPACTQYLDTFEGCGLNGCAAGPTNLHGIVPAGGACAMAPDCAPVLCTCASDASVQWFAASCGCDECAEEEIACERSKSLVACM
jgi:hypothetical protein